VAFSRLLEGPSPREREDGLHSFFSDSTAGMLRSLDRRGDTLVVDFGNLQRRIPGAGSSAGSRELLDALNATAFQFPRVAAVEFRMEGSCPRFWNWLQRACQVVTRPERRGEPPSRAPETR
jgi:spore germination protein GerM